MSSDPRFGRSIEAYLAMAERAQYRPAAQATAWAASSCEKMKLPIPHGFVARPRSMPPIFSARKMKTSFPLAAATSTPAEHSSGRSKPRACSRPEEGKYKAVTLLQMAIEDVERTIRETAA
jgi:hypothetical protein